MTRGPFFAVSRTLVRCAMLAYPAAFRRRHAPAMLDLYRERYDEAARSGGGWRRLHLVARTVANLLVTGLAERWGGRSRRRVERKSAGLVGVVQDGRAALRSLGRAPRFVVTAVVPLAVCIGAGTTIFSVVDAVLLRPLPYPEASRLVAVGNTSRRGPGLYGLSVANYRDLAERATAFEALGALMPGTFPVRRPGQPPERIQIGRVTPDFLPVLGATARLGRLLLPDDAGRKVVVLSHDLWQVRWGGDPAVVGRTLSIDDEPHTIVGVLQRGPRPAQLTESGDPQLWLPLDLADEAWDSLRAYRLLFEVVGRLDEGVTLEAARQELAGIAAALADEYPAANVSDEEGPKDIGALPLRELTVGGVRGKLALLLGSVLILLLIGCANTANLFLARGTERRRELALRAALGASRGRLVRLQLLESAALATAACGAGVLLAVLGVRFFVTWTPGNIPRLGEVAVDGRIIVVAVLTSLLTGVLFGLVPAVRGAGRQLDAELKDGGARAGGGRRERWRAALVIGQTALAVILVTGAGLLINSFVRLVTVGLGFETENVAVMNVRADSDLPADQRPAFLRAVTDRVSVLPGVARVGGSLFVPTTGAMVVQRVGLVGVDREEQVRTRTVLPGYFETLRIAVRRGRTFTADDDASAPGVAVVNEALARVLFPGGSALGRAIALPEDPDNPRRTIVGVVADVHERGLEREIEPVLYIPYPQRPWLSGVTLLVRYSGSFEPLAPAMQQAVWDVDSSIPVDEVSTLRVRVAESVAEPRFYTMLLGGFSGVALLLAAFGLYATMSYTVAQRTHELGVRMALGARRQDMFGLVLRRGLLLTGIGLVPGLGAAILLSKFLESLLFGITPTDVTTYATVVAVLGTVAFLGCYFPARRASRAEPVEVLKVQ